MNKSDAILSQIKIKKKNELTQRPDEIMENILKQTKTLVDEAKFEGSEIVSNKDENINHENVRRYTT